MARRVLAIVNPIAGGGRAARLVSRLPADLDVRLTHASGQATLLAQQAAESGAYDRVLGVGGDGTLNEIAQGLIQSAAREAAPALGVLPAGTGNDFAASLGIPRPFEAALDLALRAEPRPLDVGCLRAGAAGQAERVVLNAAGAGFDARVAGAAAAAPTWLRLGALPFVLATLRELTRRRWENRELTLTLDDGPSVTRRLLFVVVANGPLCGGGMRLCPDAARDDGLLDVCIVGDATRGEVLRLLPAVFRAGHVGHPLVQLVRARRVRLEGPPDVRAQVDGEVLAGAGLPVELSVTPRALRVVAPQAAESADFAWRARSPR